MRSIRLPILMVVFLCMPLVMPAQAGDTTNTAGPYNNGNPGDPSCNDNKPSECPDGPNPLQSKHGAGDPIHVLTGNVYHKQPVYRSGGRFPLSFSFHYNSRMRPDDLNNNFRGEWAFDYGQSLTFVSGSPNKVLVNEADGRQIIFEENAGEYALNLRNQSVAQWGSLAVEGSYYVYTSPSDVLMGSKVSEHHL